MLVSGTHFGETTGLLGLPRTVSVVAVEHSELYCLSRADLEAVVEMWPDIKQELEELCDK
jgi:CRP-like cAMP-binding protein